MCQLFYENVSIHVYFIILAIPLVGSGHSNFNLPCLNFISLACQDDYVSCLKWKTRGDCQKNVKFMSKHCARSCDTCGRMVYRDSDRPLPLFSHTNQLDLFCFQYRHKRILESNHCFATLLLQHLLYYNFYCKYLASALILIG